MPVSTAIDPSAVARVVGIQTQFVNLRPEGAAFLPQRVALIGQGASTASYSTDKAQVTSALEVGTNYGFGSPLHLAALQLLPNNGDGIGTIPLTVYPLEDDGSGVAAAGDITPTAAQTEAGSYVVSVNGIESNAFVITVGDSVADIVTAMTTAINAVLEMPVIASDDTTEVGLAAKWAGTSSNDIVVSVESSLATTGATFVITQPTGGLVNPDVDVALAQVGNVWETLIVNCMESTDTGTLDKIQTFGDGRWGALVRKPLVSFTGSGEATLATAITVPDARPNDRVNSQITAPGSVNLPLQIAARAVARIAVLANSNPPHDYGSQAVDTLVPGTDGEQWTYVQRDTAVKAGTGTTEVKDSVINLADTVTYYHPTGDDNPAYRYVVDIIKLQNIIFNLDLIFASPEWDGAPLIPDNQPTTNRDAKQPKMAKAAIASMLDNLGLNAVLSDAETAKQTIVTEINGSNPKRLDAAVTVQLSGNTNIISIDLNFGFFFG